MAVYLQKKGVSMQDIAAKLRTSGNQTYYGSEWLEGAFYNSGAKATWAPVRELTELV